MLWWWGPIRDPLLPTAIRVHRQEAVGGASIPGQEAGPQDPVLPSESRRQTEPGPAESGWHSPGWERGPRVFFVVFGVRP